MTVTTRRARGTGLLPAAAFLTALLTTVASGQWLETTIPIPDSLCVLKAPETAILDSADNEVYIGGGSRLLLVLDATTGAKLRQIPLPDYAIWTLMLNPVSRVAYCPARRPSDYADVLLVLDLATDSVVAALEGFGITHDYCLVPEQGKAFFTDFKDFVFVVDCVTPRVLDSIPVRESKGKLSYNPTAGKLYCVMRMDSAVAVIDPARDSLLYYVDVGPYEVDATVSCSPVENKVYVAYGDPDTGMVAVIDCTADTVETRIPGYKYWFTDMCYHPGQNRLFCCEYTDTVTVIDCAADSVVARFAANGFDYCAEKLYLVPELDKMYCLPPFDYFTKEMMVIDCAQMSARVVTTGFYPSDLAYNPRSGRAFVPLKNVEDIAVIDCATDSLVARIPTHFYPSALGYSSRENKVYVASASQEYVVVLDGETNEVLGTIPMWFHNDITNGNGGLACYNPELNKMCIYTEGAEDIVVIDCAADTVLAVMEISQPAFDLCLCPRYGTRLYSGGLDRLDVFDGQGDTLITSIRLPGFVWALAYDSRDAEIYASLFWGWGATVAVNCSLNRMVAQVDTGGWAVQYNPIDHKVYISSDFLHAVDAQADTVIATYVVQDYGYWLTSCFNGLDDKVYFTNDPPGAPLQLLIVDGATDSLRAMLESPGGGKEVMAMCHNQMNNKVYIACKNGRVVVVDGKSDSVVTSFNLDGPPWALTWNPQQNRVYVAQYNHSSVAVFTDSLLPGVAEEQGRVTAARWNMPTMVRGILLLPEAGMTHDHVPMTMLDITGRRVMELQPGANVVRGLSPGVYFVREENPRREAPGGAKTRKLLVLK